MAIVSIYGKYAGGIKKRQVTSNITGIIRQADILLASMADDFGNKTIDGYQAANEYLSSFQGEPRVTLKMLDNENATLTLVDNLVQAQNDITLFKLTQEAALDDIAKRSKGNPLQMILATANLYLNNNFLISLLVILSS